MKKRFASVALVSAVALGAPASASAGFTGDFEVSRWTFADTAGGSIDAGGAPGSVALTGGDTLVAGDTDFTVPIPYDTRIHFDWTYESEDLYGDPTFDSFGYLLNGIFTVLVDTGLFASAQQSGHTIVSVAAGDVFGFRANTADGWFGPSTTVISNFTVPEPASLVLFGIGLAGIGLRRRAAEPASPGTNTVL